MSIAAAGREITEVLAEQRTTLKGLSDAEAAQRLMTVGYNTVATHHARFVPVLARQLSSPLLVLLVVAAMVSFFVGERTDAMVIGVIILLSVGLGCVNEYRAEKQAEALHDRVRHTAVVVRGGRSLAVDVTELVPGDLVDLRLGDVVPADLRLVEVAQLKCNESILTGESEAVDKAVPPVVEGAELADLTSCALMGTVVAGGSGRGVVVATGPRSVFGAIAAGLAAPLLQTEFQQGLRRFSMLLVYVAGVLSVGILVINIALQRPILDALLFSLAIAVGITPQLLPAVVATSLATGSAHLAKVKVLVKRLVCIEDLGNVETLFTDKTGTLTSGQVTFARAVPGEALRFGLLATENLDSVGVGGNPLDRALWGAPPAGELRTVVGGYQRIAVLPFDHDRQLVSVLVRGPDGGLTLVSKGAPEAVMARCTVVPAEARAALAAEFEAGNRVVAVATRAWAATPAWADGIPAGFELSAADERDLTWGGILVFLDPPKEDAAAALQRLAELGVVVKVVTGDNPAVAARVCGELGLPEQPPVTGADLAGLSDDELGERIAVTTVFARVSPADKARIVGVQRRQGRGVAFLGDGVNDALALHAADVGISVDSATDVAKDAADIILLDKDLGVLADGITEGRRVFANTVKYVLMGTSSNFGNMFSAAGASVFLSFLPMLPSQILLNNLLYDTSQLAIPTDRVDVAQLRRPAHWDLRFIRRFMFVFGPLSSAFDFLTFWLMLSVFHAGESLFQSGWFVESLATQTLIIFAIRTRAVPFLRSRASMPLTWAALGAVAVGAVLPLSPLAGALGFTPLPTAYFLALVGMVIAYLGLVEVAKVAFYRLTDAPRTTHARGHGRQHHRRVNRRGARFARSRVVAT